MPSRHVARGRLLLAAVALAVATAACSSSRARAHRPQVFDRQPLPRGAVPLVYTGGVATAFWRLDGRACPRPPAVPDVGLVGWRAPVGDDLACEHDTFEHGLATPSLELRFRGVVTTDGDYDLLSRSVTVDAWGGIIARGTPLADRVARSWIELTARAPSCSATHTHPLATSLGTGYWSRPGSFNGWIPLPDLLLEGCRANEVLEVRVRLVGELQRGRFEVEAFGIVASTADDLQDAFALRRRPDRSATIAPDQSPPRPASPGRPPVRP